MSKHQAGVVALAFGPADLVMHERRQQVQKRDGRQGTSSRKMKELEDAQ